MVTQIQAPSVPVPFLAPPSLETRTCFAHAQLTSFVPSLFHDLAKGLLTQLDPIIVRAPRIYSRFCSVPSVLGDMNLFSPQPRKGRLIIIPILQKGKLRLRELG